MGKAPLLKRLLSAILAVVLAVGLTPAVPAFAEGQGSEAAPREYRGFADVYPGDWFATEDFADVDYGKFYGKAVEWARSTGVVSGYGGTNAFGPEDLVTREQLAVVLSNHAVKMAGLDASSDCAPLDAIAGAEGVSSRAREQMGWAVDHGILSGVLVDGVAWVDPQGTAQRCQVAKMASVFHRDVLGLGPDGPEAPATVDYADDLEDAGGETVSAVVDGDNITAVVDGMAGDVQAGDVVMLEASEDLSFGAG